MTDQKPVMHCGDATSCCNGAEYPTCQQNVEELDPTPCHYSDDQPSNTPYLYTD